MGTCGIMRWARERAPHASRSRGAIGLWPPLLVLAVVMLVTAVRSPASVQAAPPTDPDLRVEIVLRSIHIYDDRDIFGRGALMYWLEVCPDAAHTPCGLNPRLFLTDTFSVNSGDDVTVERVLPRDGGSARGDVSAEAGIPLYDEPVTGLYFSIIEDDAVNFDDLGAVTASLDGAYGWGLGTFTVRSHRQDGSPGDFALTYEIRRMPLPDLVVTRTWVMDSSGEGFACVQIRNDGARPADAGHFTLRTEGTIVETATLPALDVGVTYPHCIQRSRLPAHKHNLVFSIDEERTIPEMNEYNNADVLTVEAAPEAAPAALPTAMPTPQQKPTVELTIKSIRVNGKGPDSKDACKPGKNDVAVIVNNAGAGDAGPFSVWLTVDGEDYAVALDDVKAGHQQEVHFEDILLKKGEHTIEAAADPAGAVAESKSDNNAMKVTLRCKDDR